MITKMKENVDPILPYLPIMTTVDVSKKLVSNCLRMQQQLNSDLLII